MLCLYCHFSLLLLVSWWYNTLHILPLFVLINVDLGPHILQNLVDPLHPHRNFTAPFICHCRIHKQISSQTSGSWISSFVLNCHYVTRGLYPWVYMQLDTHHFWRWGQPQLWRYFLHFFCCWRHYLHHFTDSALMDSWFSHQNSHFVVVVVVVVFVRVPLELLPHATGNMYWMLSSPYCAAGTIFFILRILLLSWEAVIFDFFLTNENTHAQHTCYTHI